MLSNSCRYAIRAVIYLTKQSKENGKIGIKKISGDLGLPDTFSCKNSSTAGKAENSKFIKRSSWRFFTSERS